MIRVNLSEIEARACMRAIRDVLFADPLFPGAPHNKEEKAAVRASQKIALALMVNAAEQTGGIS